VVEGNKLMLASALMLAMVASGCTSELPVDLGGGGESTEEPEQIPGKGLEVTRFTITDNTLSPEQQAEVTLQLKNYHQRDINLTGIELYNTEPLTASNKECTPDEIQQARTGVYPVMECTWTVTAPTADEIGAFEQRPASFLANLTYESVIENFEPLKVTFKPYEQINNTQKKIMSFSNGEVQVEVQTESPAALRQNKTLGIRVTEVGSGRMGDEVSLDYTPNSLFHGWCPGEKKLVLEDEVEFNCPMRLDSDQTSERNLFFTVHYKYVQSPSLDVTIVKAQ
jgi:hypothetical protein